MMKTLTWFRLMRFFRAGVILDVDARFDILLFIKI